MMRRLRKNWKTQWNRKKSAYEAVVREQEKQISAAADAVQRTNQLHARKVGAVQLGRHSLQLGAVEHAHHGCFDHIIKMVPQCNFVAAQLLSLLVQVAAAHAGAQVTGGFIAVVGDRKHIRLKNCDGGYSAVRRCFRSSGG